VKRILLSIYMPHADPEVKKQYFKEYYKKRKAELDAYKKEWISKNPDKPSEYSKKYNDKTQEQRKQAQRKYRYGLTQEHFDKMLAEQDNKCALCFKSFDDAKVFVDHCHSIGNVRGLLCPSCNTALGLIKDDLGWLAKAKKYLTEK
jgi:hypothetical protein